jgi:hypothetical protein
MIHFGSSKTILDSITLVNVSLSTLQIYIFFHFNRFREIYGSNSLMIYSGIPQNYARWSLSKFKISNFKKLLIENNIGIKNVLANNTYLANLANTLSRKKS